MPAAPTWLRRIPDAIAQLEQWKADDVGRGDLQVLLKLGKARAVQLMHEWGASRRGGRGDLLLEKGPLIRRLKALRRGTQLAAEEQRVERLVGTLREAQISRVRVRVDPKTIGVTLAGLPAGVTIARGRIVVECRSAQDAIAKLFALAQALPHDWERFEAIVGVGDAGEEPSDG